MARQQQKKLAAVTTGLAVHPAFPAPCFRVELGCRRRGQRLLFQMEENRCRARGIVRAEARSRLAGGSWRAGSNNATTGNATGVPARICSPSRCRREERPLTVQITMLVSRQIIRRRRPADRVQRAARPGCLRAGSLLRQVRRARPRMSRSIGDLLTGSRITLSPTLLIRTSEPSKRNSLGRRTAWLRPCMKSLAVAAMMVLQGW